MTRSQYLQPRSFPVLASIGMLTAAALTSCSSVRLVPLQPVGPGESLATSSNVEVHADTKTKSPSAMPSNMTPVHLAIRNLGREAVYVDLRDIQIDGEEIDGVSHSLDAVPPATIEPRHRIASLGLDPASPFMVEQTTDSSGPRVGRTESVLIEPGFGTAAPLPSARDRSREELLESALESGVIRSGQTREGFVYFPRVPNDAGHVTLEVGVRRAPKVAPDAVLRIPYSVQG